MTFYHSIYQLLTLNGLATLPMSTVACIHLLFWFLDTLQISVYLLPSCIKTLSVPIGRVRPVENNCIFLRKSENKKKVDLLHGIVNTITFNKLIHSNAFFM